MSRQREWKPGDVALVKTAIGSMVMCTWTGDVCQPAAKHGEHPEVPHWHTSAGHYLTAHNGGRERSARPLVVIDPEDREQVERLAAAHCAAFGHSTSAAQPEEVAVMQAALREFANPTPPKPEEPRGHLAVVEDVDGIRWVSWRDPREAMEGHDRPWQSSQTDSEEWRDYRDIDVARVIWEGVTDAD